MVNARASLFHWDGKHPRVKHRRAEAPELLFWELLGSGAHLVILRNLNGSRNSVGDFKNG
jgi:hypothetical protein